MINYEIDKVMKFIDSKKDWVLKTSEYYSKLRRTCYPEVEELLKFNTICFLGKIYNLHISKDLAPSVIVSDNLRTISFHVTDRRRYNADIKRWYFEQTSKIVSERLNFIRERNPTLPEYNKASIKNQRSRWASCSKNGNLNFNLLLSSLPIEVIDYIIIHELAHLIELNHSKKFWNIVRLFDPEFLNHRRLLRKHELLTQTLGIIS
jgi:predicted metal-dependent hydrolase